MWGKVRARLMVAAAAASCVAVSACGGGLLGGGSTDTSATGGPKKVRIISVLQAADNPWVQNNIRFQKHVAEALGIDLKIVTDQGTDESNVAAVRSAIAERPDGILFDPISQAAGLQNADLLEQNRVVGATEDRLVVPNIANYTGQYLVAQVTQSNEAWGYNTVTSLIERGSKRIVSILPPHGILTVEQFWAGAQRALAEHPDVTLVQESWITQSRESAIQTMQQYLTRYRAGEIDGVVAIGSTMGLGARYAIEQAGLGRTIDVATADDDPDVIQALIKGDLAVSYGAHWTNGGWGLITLYDHLQGKKLLNRQPEFSLFRITADNAKDYSAKFLEGNVLTPEQIRSLSLTYSPKADLPKFVSEFHETWRQ